MDEQDFIERRSGEDRRQNIVDKLLGTGQQPCPGESKMPTEQNKMDEQHFMERRAAKDRRKNVVDRRLGLDRRRGAGRRRSDERKSAEEGEMSDEQFEFLMAIDEYKRKNAKRFPSWTEVLELIKALGYRKVAEPQPLASSKKEEKQAQVVK